MSRISFLMLILLSRLWCSALLLANDTGDEIKFTPKLQRAYFEIQKLRIQPARKLIEEERQLEPDNAFIHYLDNYADLHYLLISEDKTAYKKLLAKEDERLAALGRLPDSSPFKLFLQAEIRLHWAFAKIKFGNEISASWNVIKAYKMLDQNHRKFPDFLPNLKSLGILHIMIGSVPDNYAWVTKVLGLKGDVNLGVRELQTVIQKVPLFQQEAQLIDLLAHAYILQLSDTQRLKIKQLPRDQPDNLLLHFFATTILMKEGRSSEASYYLTHAPAGTGYISFPFLDYLRGELSLQQGKYNSAISYYNAFLQRYKGFNFIKDSNLKLFMCQWLGNRDTQAYVFIERARTSGVAIVESDKFAQRIADEFAAKRLLPEQKSLFKARYATDGGYLEEAKAEINSLAEGQFTTQENKAEFNYRKGRILQKSEQTDRAIPFYERAIMLSQSVSPEVGASSALQLGYIFKEKKQHERAIFYFKKAVSYKKHEYKNSIDNKARAALSELGN